MNILTLKYLTKEWRYFNMRKITTFYKQYKYDLTAFVVNIVVAYIAFYFRDNTLIFLISTIIFTASLIFIIYQRTKEKDLHLISLNKPGQEADWVGRGTFKYIRNENAFEITNSSVGFIYPKTSLWDDYYFECDFKILKMSLGLIFRAQNLSNCVMIQIFDKRIKSHLRINGEWIVYVDEQTSANLNNDKWYKAQVFCEKRKIRLKILDGHKSLIDRHITIPDNMAVVVKHESSKEGGEQEVIKQIINVDFDFGSFGLRNYGQESALVKNIYVEKL